MAERVNRGEIWMLTLRPNGRRAPVLVLTRQGVIPLLRTVMVAPVLTQIRGAPSEVAVGAREGLPADSVVNLDHVQTVDRSRLERRVGRLDPARMRAVGRALAIATGCGD